MTPEDRAEKVLGTIVGESTCMGAIVLDGSDPREHDPNRWRPSVTLGGAFKAIRDAIRDAVAAEREACAMLAEAEPRHWGEYSDAVVASRDIAAAIRARQ